MAPSHAEIWDDSALVDSWNDALEEYKKYHSIAANGDSVNEVLSSATKEDSKSQDGMLLDGTETKDATKSVPSVLETSAEQNGMESEQSEHPQHKKPTSNFQALGPNSDSKQLAPPQHLIGQVHDENLKNLLMSWYYAGYYTGLYEGQQQSKTS